MEKKDKISDIPTYSKLQNDIDGFSMLGNFMSLFKGFSPKDSSLNEALSKFTDLKKETEHFLKLPDKFNDFYSVKGWIAHETINTPIMELAIDWAEKGDIIKGEEILSDYFTSPEINFLLSRFRVLPEFSKRFDLIKNAYCDTLEKRYNSCIPVILMVIDGITNDISKSKGFFSEQTDLSAWDSIAAHSTGLKSIRDIFNETRKKTNEEEIFLPYRNGILHGRDINYGNKYVAGKYWSTLFALNDWAQALIKQKNNPPVVEKPKTVKENLQLIRQTLKENKEHKNWYKKITKDIENWKPRVFESTEFNYVNFKDFTPEKEVINILENWRSKNYGKIATQKYYFGSNEINFGKEAGKIRTDFENLDLIDYKVLSIKDETPAISKILVEINYSNQNKNFNRSIIFRMICKTLDDKTGVNGQQNLKWTFIDSFIYGLTNN